MIFCLSLKSLFPLFPHLDAVRLYILFPVTQHASVASAPKALLQGSLGSTIPCRVWLPGCCNLALETGSHRLQQLYLIFKVPLKVLTQSLGNGLASTLSAELTLLPWQLRSAGEFSWTGLKEEKSKTILVLIRDTGEKELRNMCLKLTQLCSWPVWESVRLDLFSQQAVGSQVLLLPCQGR